MSLNPNTINFPVIMKNLSARYGNKVEYGNKVFQLTATNKRAAIAKWLEYLTVVLKVIGSNLVQVLTEKLCLPSSEWAPFDSSRRREDWALYFICCDPKHGKLCHLLLLP